MVRSKEESWNWFEVDEGGEMVSVRWSGEVDKATLKYKLNWGNPPASFFSDP